jgi:hypothetical protein
MATASHQRRIASRFISTAGSRLGNFVACLATMLGVIAQTHVASADTVVLDDNFNDYLVGTNLITTNIGGIGKGFTVFTSAAQSATVFANESNGFARLSVSANGAVRASIGSRDSIGINGGLGTRYEFKGVSFTNQVANTGTGSTDRLMLGVQSSATAGDWPQGPLGTIPAGFWIQINSDGLPNAVN